MKSVSVTCILLFVVSLAWAGPPAPTGMSGMPDFSMGKGQTAVLDFSKWWEDEDMVSWGYFGCTPTSSTAKVTVWADSVFIYFRADANWTGTATVAIAFMDDEMLDSHDTVTVTVKSTVATGTAPYVSTAFADTTMSAGDTITVSTTSRFANQGGGAFSYAIVTKSSKLKATAVAASSFKLAATAAWSGTTNVVVLAQNADSLMAPDTFKVMSSGTSIRTATGAEPVLFAPTIQWFGSQNLRITNPSGLAAQHRLFSADGRQILAFQTSGRFSETFDCPILSSGIYLMRSKRTDGKQAFVQKLVRPQ